MEILSTGEKIKRARVYKGITLKELCDENISISKMSCIENGKVKAEQWVLEIVAKKLDIDINYLIEDVREQLENNLKLIKKRINEKGNEEDLKTNIDYALEYKYDDLAFEFMHILFLFYLEELRYNEIQEIMNQYYEVAQRLPYDSIIFYRDMAKYFYNNKEYTEALAYYSKLRVSANNMKEEVIAEIVFCEARCYLKLGQDEKAYSLLKGYIKNCSDILDPVVNGKILSLYAGLLISFDENESHKYKTKALDYLKDNPKELSKAKVFYGENYFKCNNREAGIKEMEEAVKLFPKDTDEKYCEMLNKAIQIYIENGELEVADEMSSEALNIAIGCDNVRLIERAYYFKAAIFERKGLYEQSEMYMNLSVDSLMKFGNYSQRYDRYIEMANMYHHIGEISESIKYFTLAMNMEKRL